MDFPDRDVAMAWVGRTVVDRDGAEIGACTAVFSDDATQLTEWVCSELAGAAVFIPAVGAAESAGQVQVAVSRADVAAAPAPAPRGGGATRGAGNRGGARGAAVGLVPPPAVAEDAAPRTQPASDA